MKQIISTLTLAVFLLAATFASQAQAADKHLNSTQSMIDLNLDPPDGGSGGDDETPIGG